MSEGMVIDVKPWLYSPRTERAAKSFDPCILTSWRIQEGAASSPIFCSIRREILQQNSEYHKVPQQVVNGSRDRRELASIIHFIRLKPSSYKVFDLRSAWATTMDLADYSVASLDSQYQNRTQYPFHQISLASSRDAGRSPSVMFGRCPFRGSSGQADSELSFGPIVSIHLQRRAHRDRNNSLFRLKSESSTSLSSYRTSAPLAFSTTVEIHEPVPTKRW
jgi:hypothetical protein